jgi:hypothetical protein
MNSPQRELWVYVTKQNKLAKASDIIGNRLSINICRPAGALDRTVALNPQLALWATDISLASPTG